MATDDDDGDDDDGDGDDGENDDDDADDGDDDDGDDEDDDGDWAIGRSWGQVLEHTPKAAAAVTTSNCGMKCRGGVRTAGRHLPH